MAKYIIYKKGLNPKIYTRKKIKIHQNTYEKSTTINFSTPSIEIKNVCFVWQKMTSILLGKKCFVCTPE